MLNIIFCAIVFIFNVTYKALRNIKQPCKLRLRNTFFQSNFFNSIDNKLLNFTNCDHYCEVRRIKKI